MESSECLFCKIAAKKIPAEILFEDDQVLAFKDIRPQAPAHVLVIPKIHIPRFADLKPEHSKAVMAIHQAAVKLAEQMGLTEENKGFRVVVNNGPAAGQEVYHLHYHLLGGRNFAWPPG